MSDRDVAQYGVQKGRLAAAIGTDDTDHVTFLHFHRDVFKDYVAAILHRDVLDIYNAVGQTITFMT